MMIRRSTFTQAQLQRLDIEIEAYHRRILDCRSAAEDRYDIDDLQIRLVGFCFTLDVHQAPNRHLAVQISAGDRLVHAIGARVFEGQRSLSLQFESGYPSTSATLKAFPLSIFKLEDRPYTEFNFGMMDPSRPLIFDIHDADTDRSATAVPRVLDMILVCSLPSKTMLDRKFSDPRIAQIARIVSMLDGPDASKAEAADLLTVIDGDRSRG